MVVMEYSSEELVFKLKPEICQASGVILIEERGNRGNNSKSLEVGEDLGCMNTEGVSMART